MVQAQGSVARGKPSRIVRVGLVVSPSNTGDAPSSRQGRARSTVVVAFVFALILNFTLSLTGAVNPRLRDPAYGDKLAKLKTNRPDILMLGSSRTLLGFHAERFEQQTGCDAFNFGTPATGPITQLVYWNRLLADGVRPRHLLVEVLPSMFADGSVGPIEQAFLNGERLSAHEVSTVERFGFDPAITRSAWRESIMAPWWKLRFQLLGRISPSWLPWNLRFDWSRTSDAHGWATPPRHDITDAERTEQMANARNEYAQTLATLEPNGRPFMALQELIVTCQQNEISVSLVRMPESDSFRKLYPAGLEDRLSMSLDSLGVPVIDARFWLVESDFYDGHHMFTHGAIAFTDRLMLEVRK
jgi:hypothetical protein